MKKVRKKGENWGKGEPGNSYYYASSHAENYRSS